MIALGGLFAAFIALCGGTHTLNVLKFLFPENHSIDVAITAVMLLCAIVSVITAVVGFKLFPTILEILSKFELNSEGNLENAENYLLEVVEMVKESIMVISDDVKVLKCNEATKALFSPDVVGTPVTNYIHPEDVQIFHDTVIRVLGSYNFTPISVEYRIKCNDNTYIYEDEPFEPECRVKGLGGSGSNNKIHCEAPAHAESDGVMSVDSNGDHDNRVMALNALATRTEEPDKYIWIESTICKGMRLNHSEDFEYDLKMASRNIQDRKKQQLLDSRK